MSDVQAGRDRGELLAYRFYLTLSVRGRLLFCKQLADMARERQLENKNFHLPEGLRPERVFGLKSDEQAARQARALLEWWDQAIQDERVTDQDLRMARIRFLAVADRMDGVLRAQMLGLVVPR
ncbi:MAG: hypothetical protein KGJ86_17365 [Chloroflexota bacterium]|nr:hypothetical protein [Chloroflexota bacterium]